VQFVFTKHLICEFILYSSIAYAILSIPSLILPTIGNINWGAMRGRKAMTDKSSFLSIPFPLLATLAGLIDGDGYIAITRTAKGYIEVLLSISLDVRDGPMLCHIHETLGFGRIAGPFLNQNGSSTIKLIFSRTDLQELLFPLFQHHSIFFLTNTRRSQFDLAIYIFCNNVTRFDMLPSFVGTNLLHTLPSLPAEYLSLNFFRF